MNISEHFTREELVGSYIAERRGISNEPTPDQLRNLYETAGMLERVRVLCNNQPVYINSGFRSETLNVVVGGAVNSAHCHGRAADFRIPGFGSPYEVTERIIVSDLDFDKVIYEGTWVHIQIRDNPRREAYIANFDGGRVRYRAWGADG